ncbi:hypothetical protein CDL12_27896 [Handroanthus impetiginosus]|uniref:Knottin scorpion toxin-like domain-containing protein n=1 Tax=Handroanthus impetiginosus TaxID=429701 RepID=A0A2G9G2S1_9LAMI|nr:hypothetical protein CDL12_27896 [Handroanthus impetiginosus]
MQKWALIAILIGVLVLAPKQLECAIGIDLNPCTLPQCIAACKKVLGDKYVSATCAAGPKGKYCICLG